MNYPQKKEKMEYLLEMIKKDRVKSLKQVANNFNCSTRTIERMINILRNEGCNIVYSKTSQKYFIDK